MKKWICMLLLVLTVTGCAKQEDLEATQPETTVAVTMETTTPETLLPETAPTLPETTVPATVPVLPEPPTSDEDFVRVLDYIPTATQELMYATDRNFTGQVIYAFEDAYLRWGTVRKLQMVCADLEELGLYIKIWDGFRPVSAQLALWEVCPDPTYVANPTTGHSSHSRGNTIDLTLVDANGVELVMPTGFDDFSEKANRNYSDCTPEETNNAQLLEILMEKHGFSGYYGEWWHYSDSVSYPVETVFEPQADNG